MNLSNLIAAASGIVVAACLFMLIEVIRTRKPTIKLLCEEPLLSYGIDGNSEQRAEQRVVTRCQCEKGHLGLHGGISGFNNVWWEKAQSR